MPKEKKTTGWRLCSVAEHMLVHKVLGSSPALLHTKECPIQLFFIISVCIQVDIQNVSFDKLMILPLTEKIYKCIT